MDRSESASRLSQIDWDKEAAKYRQLRETVRNPYGRWLMLIKELRSTHQCSILEAESMALQNRHRRRWVEKAINAGNPCRKYALRHIRLNPGRSLIEREGDSFTFWIPAP